MEPTIEDGQQYPMTLQQYYDKLYESAYDGTFPGVMGMRCVYRWVGADGKEHRCAGGLLLLEEDFNEVEHNSLVDDGYNRLIFSKRLPEGMTIDQLRSVQYCHDRCANPAYASGFNSLSFVRLINDLPVFRNVFSTITRKEPKEITIA